MGDATCSVRVVNRPIPSSKNRLRKRATVPSKMLMKATSPPTSFGASRSLFGPKVEGTFVSIRSRSVPALNEKCCWGDVRFPRALVDTQRGIDSNRPPPSFTCLVASKPRTTHNKGPTQENKGNKKRWYISILSCFSCLFHHGSRSEKVTSVFQGPNMFAPFWCPPSEESDNVPIDAPDMASRSHCIPSHIGSDSESLITNYPGTSVRGTSRFAVVMDEDHDTPSALPFIDICSGSSTRVLESPPVCSLSHVSSHGCDPSHVLRNDVLQLCGGAASTSCSTNAHVMRPVSVSSMIPSSHSMSVDVLRLQHSWAALEQSYSLHHVGAQIRTVGSSPRTQRVPNGTHSKQEENSTGPSLLHRDEAKIMQLVLSPVVTEPLQHPHSLEMSLTIQSPPAWLSPGTENSEELIPPFSERLSGMTALRHDTNPTRTERDMGLNPTVDSHLIAREVRIRMDPDEPSKTVPSTEIHAACMESRIPHQHSHNTTPTTVRHSFRTRPRTNTVGPNDDEMPLSPQSVDVTRETSVHTQKGTTCVHLDSSSIILIPQNFELSPQKGLKENVHYIVDVGSTPLDKHPPQQDDSTFLTSNRFTLAPCMKIDVDSIRRVPIFTHRIVSNHARKSDVYCSQKSALIRRPTAMRPTTQ